MKLIFMGSPTFAVPSLQKLIESDHEIVAVYTQPPRPAGRGQKLQKTDVHQLAEAHNLPVRTPTRLKDDALTELQNTPCDAIVVVAYGLLLPKGVLNHAPCLNVHPSALPRWRGAAPLQHTLLVGDTTTEVCIMQLDSGMDTGPVYQRVPIEIDPNETFGDLHDRLALVGADALLDVLNNFDDAVAVPQVEIGATHATKITSDMKPIDWKKSALEIHNHVRGLSPFPSATLKNGDEIWKVFHSKIATNINEKNSAAGTVMAVENTGITVACGQGFITLTYLQRPSKKAMQVIDFIKGISLKTGDMFT